MEYIQSPTIKSSYTKDDLREYALYRKSRDIENINSILCEQNIESPEDHEAYREPLSFSKQTVVHILLSTGGDADGYKLTFDEDKNLISGVYYWADWGVYEEVELKEEELEAVDNLYYITDLLLGV